MEATQLTDWVLVVSLIFNQRHLPLCMSSPSPMDEIQLQQARCRKRNVSKPGSCQNQKVNCSLLHLQTKFIRKRSIQNLQLSLFECVSLQVGTTTS